MKRTYTCPHCSAILNPESKIILRAENGDSRGLVLLSPKPGCYDVLIPEGFKVRKRDAVAFACPACGKDLTSRRDKAMAEIAFSGPKDQEGVVAFSRTYGKQETYVITPEKVQGYGRHADVEPVNFWGSGAEDDV